MEKKRNPFLGVVLCFCPMLAALACQLVVSYIGSGVYGIIFSLSNPIDSFATIEDYAAAVQEAMLGGSFLSVTTFVAECAMLLMAALWYLHWRKDQSGIKQVFTPKYIGFAVSAGLAFQCLVTLLLGIVFSLLPEVSNAYGEMMDALLQKNVLYVLSVAVLAPIAEELVFRGVTLKLASRYFNIGAAMIISSLLFGLMHLSNGGLGSIVQMVYAFFMGMLFAFLVVRFRSVWASILVHLVVNLSAEILSVLIPEDSSETLVLIARVVVGIVCLVIAGFIYKKNYSLPKAQEN